MSETRMQLDRIPESIYVGNQIAFRPETRMHLGRKPEWI